MNYTPHTDAEVRHALRTIGVDSVQALFHDIPSEILDPTLDLPAPMDEATLLRHLRALAARNDDATPCFLGGGVRAHFQPAVTRHMASRPEFVTAYTPYQPEVAQGVLQATFEYQTMMSELTGLPVSNASMYDGATAVAEAATLAMRATRRQTIVVSRGVHPESREVLATYLSPLDVEIRVVDLVDGVTGDVGDLSDAAAVIVQSPNYLGSIEPMARHAQAAHAAGALMVGVVDPLSLAVLASPGALGCDVAVGDGQTLGLPMQFGGPHFGFMVVTEPLIRQLPGRLVGETVDVDGRRAYVLTLQAREQHIRRDKAKSNICSNHQLAATMAAIQLSALGPQGLRDVAEASVRNAHTLADRLSDAGYEVGTGAPFFAEFPVKVATDPRAVRSALHERGLRAGLPVPLEYGLGSAVTFACTELHRPEDIDALVHAMTIVSPPAARMEVTHGR